VRFIAEGAAVTRVELEHRELDRFGADEGAQMREKVDAPNGWSAIMALYAESASKKE